MVNRGVCRSRWYIISVSLSYVIGEKGSRELERDEKIRKVMIGICCCNGHLAKLPDLGGGALPLKSCFLSTR